VLQCPAGCCSVLPRVFIDVSPCATVCCNFTVFSVSRCDSVLLQCIAVCCGVLQHVFSVLNPCLQSNLTAMCASFVYFMENNQSPYEIP